MSKEGKIIQVWDKVDLVLGIILIMGGVVAFVTGRGNAVSGSALIIGIVIVLKSVFSDKGKGVKNESK